MAAHSKPGEPVPGGGLASATVDSGPRIRTRSVGAMVVLGEPVKAPTVGVMREALGLVGVPADLVDAAFLRRLAKATAALLDRANTEDETVLARLEDDPVAAYRDIDPEVADRLARIRDAARAGSIPPPDLGRLPKTRRAQGLVRPIVRSAALEEAVDGLRARVLSRAAADPAGLGSFLDDPAAGVDAAAGDAAHPVRRTLTARLGAPAPPHARTGRKP